MYPSAEAFSPPLTQSRRKRLFASALPALGPAPSRVRLWKAGENRWDGGTINLTPAAAARVMSEYESRGNPLSMDIEHAITLAERRAAAEGREHVEEPPLPGAGYCALELVETPAGPELWFLPRWSDCGREAPVPGEVCCAKHQIESGQRCEFSPDWDGDPTTGEPIRINRISLVLDGATHGIGLLAMRAVSRGATAMDELEEHRAAYRHAAKMAASEDPKTKKIGEQMCSHIAEHMGALGIDLDGEHKEPDGDEAKPEEAAEPIPGGAEGEHIETPEAEHEEPRLSAASQRAAKPTPKVATKPGAARATASKAVDINAIKREVLGEVAQRDELKALLDANADRISEPQRRWLAGKGLRDARDFIATLPARPQPAGPGAGSQSPSAKVRPWRRSLSEAENLLASRVRDRIGITEADEDAFDQKVADDGSYTVSIVDIVKNQQAARSAARRVA